MVINIKDRLFNIMIRNWEEKYYSFFIENEIPPGIGAQLILNFQLEDHELNHELVDFLRIKVKELYELV